MVDKSQAMAAMLGTRDRRKKGAPTPKYILKTIEKNQMSAYTTVYFCKNQLISDVMEQVGNCDMIIQQYVI